MAAESTCTPIRGETALDCAVLFADVAGSTALYELLGDERAFALVGRCLDLMSREAAAAGGRVVKTIGDAVLAVFPSADDAATAAAAMQHGVEALGGETGIRLRLRIGFHAGPVVERDGDVFGDTVNLASRLCDLASRGQVVTDEDTAHRLSALHLGRLRRLFAVPVKGKEQEVELVEIEGDDGAGDNRTVITAPREPSGGRARLTLGFDGRSIEMGPERRKVRIGRDAEADCVVRDRGASRAHATIERRRDRFVLSDHSSNGTWVTIDGQPETVVHHAEFTLSGHGWLAFGQPRGEGAEGAECAEFRCL